jgi:hypothetical protein
MKWTWQDVNDLPSDVYDDLVRWLVKQDDGDVMDLD